MVSIQAHLNLRQGYEDGFHQEQLRELVLIGLEVKPGKWEVIGDSHV